MNRLIKNIYYILFILLAGIACSIPKDEAVEYVKVNGEKIPKIHVEKITDRTELKLSDWFEDIQLIELESTEESIFGVARRSFVGEDYIIISTSVKGILMFSSKGAFIKVLAKVGKGPGEVAAHSNREEGRWF